MLQRVFNAYNDTDLYDVETDKIIDVWERRRNKRIEL